MARDDDDDLYDEEFDFVDEDEQNDEREPGSATEEGEESPLEEQAAEDEVDEYGRPQPQANYVVHVYEQKKFKRTIDRPFTPEEAEAFATEFNRTSKAYHHWAVAGKNDVQPKKTLD